MKVTTLLLRQIHPSFIQEGRPTSQAFRPTPKDEKKLSVYDGDQIAPEPSWAHYTQGLKQLSAGVMGVSVSECQALDLPALPDPEPFPEHVLIDFSDCSGSVIDKKCKKLKAKAVERGWLYQPGDE